MTGFQWSEDFVDQQLSNRIIAKRLKHWFLSMTVLIWFQDHQHLTKILIFIALRIHTD